jgi:hypothetical protein
MTTEFLSVKSRLIELSARITAILGSVKSSVSLMLNQQEEEEGGAILLGF